LFDGIDIAGPRGVHVGLQLSYLCVQFSVDATLLHRGGEAFLGQLLFSEPEGGLAGLSTGLFDRSTKIAQTLANAVVARRRRRRAKVETDGSVARSDDDHQPAPIIVTRSTRTRRTGLLEGEITSISSVVNRWCPQARRHLVLKDLVRPVSKALRLLAV